MAYANLVNIPCADKNEWLCRFRDFICKRNGTYDYSTTGIGWTLIDSSYATDEDGFTDGDWIVVYSPGENGDEDIYIYIFPWTGNVRFIGYLAWDSSTHTGTTDYRYNTSNSSIRVSTEWPLYIYGDLDMIYALAYYDSDNCSIGFFGKVAIPISDDVTGEVATCSSSLSSGSDVSITVDSVPSNWAVDRELYIRTTHNDDNANARMEKITIKTLVSNTITADLTNSYTANCKLCDNVPYIATAHLNALSTTYGLFHAGGDDNGSIAFGWDTVILGNVDPGYYEDAIGLIAISVSFVLYGAIGFLDNIKRTGTHNAEFGQFDVLEESDGTTWRCFKCYSGIYLALREV